MKLSDVLEYEIASSWWAGFVPAWLPWLSDKTSSYYVWKTKRKFVRYQVFKKLSNSLNW